VPYWGRAETRNSQGMILTHQVSGPLIRDDILYDTCVRHFRASGDLLSSEAVFDFSG